MLEGTEEEEDEVEELSGMEEVEELSEEEDEEDVEGVENDELSSLRNAMDSAFMTLTQGQLNDVDEIRRTGVIFTGDFTTYYDYGYFPPNDSDGDSEDDFFW